MLMALFIAVFMTGSVIFYTRVQNELRSTQSAVVAKAISFGLYIEIKDITRLLAAISQFQSMKGIQSRDVYNMIAKVLLQKYPDFFYGVNYVSPQGYIMNVYPVKPNEKALGKNLLEREDLKSYLETSRDLKTTAMSHRLLTYQGIYAVVIYQPLFDEHHHFKGWLNVLIDIDHWLLAQTRAQGWDNAFVQMTWVGPHENQAAIVGPHVSQRFSSDFKILNQNIRITVGWPEASITSVHNRHFLILWLSGIVLILIVFYLLYRQGYFTYKLSQFNEQLSIKNILLNSLTHDIASPLSTISLTSELIFQKQGESISEIQKDRIRSNFSTLQEMLSSVRNLSRLELTKDKLKLQSINLSEAVNKSLQIIQALAEEKQIRFQTQNLDQDLYVEADEKTLINNVIPNVLSNAIKFTKPQSTILITVQKSKDEIWLQISDQGQGFSSEEVQSFNQGELLSTKAGTAGEEGSGLGLAQVLGFMHLYGGTAIIGNSARGAVIKLQFKASEGTH